MTQKNIFVYKLFLSLNFSNFTYFLYKNSNPWKNLPPSFPETPFKNWDPVKPQLFENLVGGLTPQQKGGSCTQRNNKEIHKMAVGFDIFDSKKLPVSPVELRQLKCRDKPVEGIALVYWKNH